MNKIRENSFNECYKHHFKILSYTSAQVYSDVRESVGNIIMPGAYIGPNVNIGIGNIFYSNINLTYDIEIKL